MSSHSAAIGKEIRRRREGRGWTLRELADHAGIDFGYLGKIERGSNASTTTYEAVAGAFGLSLVGLFSHAARRVHPPPLRRQAAGRP